MADGLDHKTKPHRPTIKPATLLSSKSHQVPGQLLVTELFFEVPLDHSRPEGERLRIFCRSAKKFEKPAAPKAKDDHDELPFFVYIPGGPGFGCPPPQSLMEFTNEVLGRGYQFLCFDHRGMGLSTPATAATIAAKGSAQEQAEYLKHFRAENAVRDLEAIRKCLTADYPEDKKKWSIMGSSYGGFVCLNYLSFHPEGLREAFPVAGLAPITQSTPDLPIEKLFKKVLQRNKKYYAKYPEDKASVHSILNVISGSDEIRLPSGDKLTVGRFLEMGLFFGFHGGLDAIHHVVLRAASDIDIFGYMTRPTLSAIEGMSWFNDHPLYAVLHGSLYSRGMGSNWVFDRVLEKFAEFNPEEAMRRDDEVLFTGEMVFRRAFTDHGELKPLVAVAELLEAKADWDDLYDLEQLRANTVPVYAAVYVEDMYVDFDHSMETASIVKGCKTFVTNMLYHDAIRSKCDQVLKSLFALRDDTID